MAVQASSSQLSKGEIKRSKDAQETYDELREMFGQDEEQLHRNKFSISSQGTLYHIKGDRWSIVVPKILQQKIIQANHKVPAIEHLGLNKIVNHIKRAFWWRDMWSTGGKHVRSYLVCDLMKSDHKKKAGVLWPILLRDSKFHQTTIDLVLDLPESDGKTAIAIFVDRLSKMVHFGLYSKEVSVEKYAQLFINHVFKYHGLPEAIISNRDPRFTNRFWKELF